MNGEDKIKIKGYGFYYGSCKVLENISMDIPANTITAFIGPSGCGKSTFLRSFNRMNDLLPGTRVEGKIIIDGMNIYENGIDVVNLRRKIGMVFQRPNPFPKTIYENVVYGPKLHSRYTKSELDDIVKTSLVKAALWDEVKNKLNTNALDPISTQKIEDLIDELKSSYTIIIVTHNMQQAARVSQKTAFLLTQEIDQPATLVEYDDTNRIFTSPKDKRTEDYVTGRFG